MSMTWQLYRENYELFISETPRHILQMRAKTVSQSESLLFAAGPLSSLGVDSRLSTCRTILRSLVNHQEESDRTDLFAWMQNELINIRGEIMQLCPDDISCEVRQCRDELNIIKGSRPSPVPLCESLMVRSPECSEYVLQLHEWREQRRASKRLELRAFETQVLKQESARREQLSATLTRREIKRLHHQERKAAEQREREDLQAQANKARKERWEYYINSGAYERVKQSTERMKTKRHPELLKRKVEMETAFIEPAIKPLLRRFNAFTAQGRLKVL